MRKNALLLVSVALGAPLALRAQVEGGGPPSGEPLSLDDVLDLLDFADRQPVDLSPDGELLAISVVRPTRAAEQRQPNNRFFIRTGATDQTLGAGIRIIDVETGRMTDLTPETGISWGPAWSPDSQTLAFYSDEDGVARLWLWDRRTGEARPAISELARPDFGFETPRWSPDGTRILLKVLPEGMTLEELAAVLPDQEVQTDEREDLAVDPLVVDRTPSVTVLATDPSLLGHREGDPPPAPGGEPAGEAGAQAVPVSWTNKYLSDLVVVDVATGRLQRIAHGVKPLAFSFSPDGRRVLFTDMRWLDLPGGGGDAAYSLVVLDLAAADRRVLAPDALRDYGLNVSWGPAGRRIAYIDEGGAVVVVGALTSGEPLSEWREIARFDRPGTDYGTDYRPPLWADGNRLFLLAADTVWQALVREGELLPVGTVPGHQLRAIVADAEAGRMWTGPDGRSAYVVTRDRRTKRMGFHRIPLTGGEGAEPVWRDDVYLGPDFPYHLDLADEEVVFVAQSADHPQEVWITDTGFRAPRRLSSLHPGLERFTLGSSRLVEWISGVGDTIQGTLLLPPRYEGDTRLPLVVHVYPGAGPSSAVNRFGLEGAGAYNQHLLATRGYAVWFPDTPFEPGEPVDGLAGVVLPGIDRLIQAGIVDPERIGVTGHSWGGYATMALLTRSTRFAAAIAEQGYADLFGRYGQLRTDGSAVAVTAVEGYLEGMGGSPWDDGMRERYIRQSPFFQLDRVQTPVLLIHGDADQTVPLHLSQQMFVALRRLGKPAKLIVYHGEGHGVGAWQRRNLEDYWERVREWWARWLGGP